MDEFGNTYPGARVEPELDDKEDPVISYKLCNSRKGNCLIR